MIVALALTLFALPQETVPETKAQPSAQEIQVWWEGLSKAEQDQYRERLQRYRELQPTMQEELGRRHELLRDERQRIKDNLSEAEQLEFQKLERHERQRFLDERAHRNFRQRGERLANDFPHVGPGPPQEDWKGRHDRVAKVFEQRRAPQVREAVTKASADGWLGATAAKWLETAPIHEAMVVLGEVRKWQFLQQAAASGLWEEMGLDDSRRREITGMSAFDFFLTMRGQREGAQRGAGAPEGPGEFGKFGEFRGEGGGPGRGQGLGPGHRRGGPGGPPPNEIPQPEREIGPPRGSLPPPSPNPPGKGKPDSPEEGNRQGHQR